MDTTHQQEAIQALLKVAQIRGTPDLETGRRRWVRYRVGTPLEISTDSENTKDAWHAITHHISGGGLGFWTRQDFAPGQRIFVREYKIETKTTWLPARVMYSVVGMSGYLVGVSFDNPIEPTVETNKEEPSPIQRREPVSSPANRDRDHLPLGDFCSLPMIFGGTLALCAAVILIVLVSKNIALAWQVPACCLLVLLICVTVSRRILSRESACLNAIAGELDGLVSGQQDAKSASQGRTREWFLLYRAMERVRHHWDTRTTTAAQQQYRVQTPAKASPSAGETQPRDLENLLTSIQIYSEMLEKNLTGLTRSDQAGMLEIISQESGRLSNLVDDLLEAQRLHAGSDGWSVQEMQLADAVRALVHAYQPVAERSGVALAVDCPPSLPLIHAAGDKLTQAIGNLVDHAMKAAGPGGIVRLTVETRDNEVRIRVSDSGPGIPRDAWDAIFDPFAQLPNQEGKTGHHWGLGLYVARKIVEGHRGRLWLDSEVGEGTDLIVALPVGPAPASDQPAQDGPAFLASVLVCDADPELAALMANELRKARFDVRTAHSAARILQLLSEAVPDVLVTDVAFPDMPARDFLATLAEQRARGFQLVLHAAEGDCREQGQPGVDLMLRRPVFTSDLVRAVTIATMKKQKAGFLSLIVGSHGVDVERLCQALEARGHMVLKAKDAADSAGILSQYPVDLVIATTATSGGCRPETLHALEQGLTEVGRLVILRSDLNEKQCSQLCSDRVFHLPCRLGQEHALASALHDLWRETTLAVASTG